MKMPCHMMKLFGNFKTAKMSFAFRPWEFETLMQPTKNIFFVAPTQSKGHLRGSFLLWRERSSFVGEAFRLPFITGGFSGGETPPLRKAQRERIFAAGEYPVPQTAKAYLQANASPPYKCGQSRTPVPTDFVCDSPP